MQKNNWKGTAGKATVLEINNIYSCSFADSFSVTDAATLLCC